MLGFFAVRMTAEARLAVVRISRLVLVLFVHSGLLVLVTVDAGELPVVARPMTFRAIHPMLPAVDGEGVIENGLCPAHMVRQVTQFAIGWEAGRQVVRIPGRLIVTRVATEAVSRQATPLAVTGLAV